MERRQEKFDGEPMELPVTYEVAEMVFEAERPPHLRRRESVDEMEARLNYTYHFVEIKLAEEGNTLPIIEEGYNGMVTKHFSEWRQYWLEAAVARAGIK